MAEIPYGYCRCGCGQKTNIPTFNSRADGRVKGQPMRFLRGHSAHKGIGYEVDEATGCWIWQGHIDPRTGYGSITRGRKSHRTHRWFYEQANGPIPQGLQLDHLCRNRACCNPDHLEPVTRSENLRRGMGPAAVNARARTCKRGHPLEGDNVRVIPATEKRGPRRVCKQCEALRRPSASARARRAALES